MARLRSTLAIAFAVAAAGAQAQYRDSDLPALYRGIEAGVRPISLVARQTESEIQRFAEQVLRGSGWTVWREGSLGACPLADSCSLRLDGRGWDVSPVLPNGPAGFAGARGRVLFAGNGRGLAAFEGRDVRSSIVFLPVSAEPDWIRAAELGASAAVFYGPKPNRVQSEAMFLRTPLPFPRYWMEKPPPRSFEGSPARLEGGARWGDRKFETLRAELPGTDLTVREERILLIAHTDALSAALGQEDLSGIRSTVSAALGIAERLGRRSGRRPMEIALVSGHRLALQGEREFVARRLAEGRKYFFVASLDLTSAGGRLAMSARGSQYETRPESTDLVRRLAAAIASATAKMAETWGGARTDLLLDGVNESDGKPWKSLFGAPLALGAEPFVLAGYPAIGFATADDARLETAREDSPAAGRRLESQTRTLAAILELVRNQPSREGTAGVPAFPSEARTGSRTSLVSGFSRLEGRAVQFDPRRSFLPDAPVPGAVAIVPGRRAVFAGSLGDHFATADSDGRFAIEGLPAVTAYWHSERPQTEISAWRPPRVAGEPFLAPTRGTAGAAVFERAFPLATAVKSVQVVLFPAHAVPLFDIADPLSGDSLGWGRLFDPATRAEPADFDLSLPVRGEPPVGVAWLPRGRRIELVLGRSQGDLRLMDSDPAVGGPARLGQARSAVRRNGERIARFGRFGMAPAPYLQLHSRSVAELAKADAAARNRSWSEARDAAEVALGAAMSLYGPLAAAPQDALYGALFYLALLIPFVLAVERIVWPQRLLVRRLVLSLVLFAVGFFGLQALHPAFAVLSSPFVVFVGFAMAGLSAWVSAFVAAKFDEAMRGGPSRFEGRSGGWTVSIGLALASLRRRPLRTGLSVATVTLLAASLTLFTSFTAVPGSAFSRGGGGSGTWLMRKGFGAFSPWDGPRPGAHRIAWLTAGPPHAPGTIRIEANGRVAEIRALAGDEARRSGGAVAVPPAVADALELPAGTEAEGRILGATVRLRREEAPLEPGALPVDFPASGLFQAQPADASFDRPYVRFEPSQVAVADLEWVRARGGDVRLLRLEPSMARPESLVRTSEALEYQSQGERRRAHPAWVVAPGGFAMAGMALAMALLFLFNSLLASAHERRGEIGILASLGMGPAAIGRLFLAESAILGIGGAVLGFFGAHGLGAIARAAAYSGVELNLSSSTSVLGAGLVLAACLAAAIYPARLAVRASAPAHEDELLAVRPQGNRWSLALPFLLAPAEGESLLEHLHQWLASQERHPLGAVVTRDCRREEGSVACSMWLAPFELGVQQKATFRLADTAQAGAVSIVLDLDRTGGDAASWERVNRRFFESLRRELLHWRTQERRTGHAP